MRTIALALAAAALGVPAMPATAAFGAPDKAREAQNWRGADGRIYCRRPNGTTGIMVGGGGAAAGRDAKHPGSRSGDSTLGAALQALIGGESQRSSPRRCR